MRLSLKTMSEEATLYEIKLEPDVDTVHYLGDLLERAKAGEIQGFAIVIAKSKGCTANGWVGIDVNPMSVIGEIEAMKVDMIRSKVEQRYDCCGSITD